MEWKSKKWWKGEVKRVLKRRKRHLERPLVEEYNSYLQLGKRDW